LIVGHQQLVRVLRGYVEHYNRRRPHRSFGQAAPVSSACGHRMGGPTLGKLRCRDVLEGLIDEHEWAA
jgi:putative transposase